MLCAIAVIGVMIVTLSVWVATAAGASGDWGVIAHQGAPFRLSSSSAEREVTREKVLALVRERPGITKAELKDAAGLSGAGVAQNLRRMLDRGEVREEALPGAVTGYRIA